MGLQIINIFFVFKFEHPGSISPSFISRCCTRAPLAPFLVSHTCRDFTCPYPRWGSAPVSAKPMSTVHRAYHLHSKATSQDSGYRRLLPFRLHNLYTSIIELTNPQKGIKKYENIQFKIFSDNIIIAKQLSQENKANDVVTLLTCV